MKEDSARLKYRYRGGLAYIYMYNIHPVGFVSKFEFPTSNEFSSLSANVASLDNPFRPRTKHIIEPYRKDGLVLGLFILGVHMRGYSILGLLMFKLWPFSQLLMPG